MSISSSRRQEIEIRPMNAADWPRVLHIYLQGISTGQATFEAEGPAWERWDSSHHPFGRLVASCSDRPNEIAGWAALSPVSSRAAYAGVAEVSVYVASDSRGLGIGRTLLESLIAAAEGNGIWTLQASIFPENRASAVLHQHCGFREVGVRKKIGKLNGRWRDTVLFERRSERVGID